jgi:hypothetical protein
MAPGKRKKSKNALESSERGFILHLSGISFDPYSIRICNREKLVIRA